MSLRQCVSLLALASLLLLRLFAAAEFDPAAACSENCRFVVVPSLGPPGPAGPPGLNGMNGKDGLNGTNGLNGKDGLNATIDASITYQDLKLEKPLISNGVVTTRGRLTMGDVPILTIGSGDGVCNVTQTGTVLSVVGGSCTFSHASVGTLVTWPDGATSLVLSSFSEVGSRTATVSVSLERPTPTIVKVFVNTLMTQNFSVFQDKLALKGFTGGIGSCSVVLDMNRMKGGRSQSVWSFPDPRNPNAPVNYFVGEDVAQTISNKVVNASVIQASETNGHFRLTKYASLGIGGSILEATGANAGFSVINASITGNLLAADRATFFTTHIGCVIEWADGVNAVIQSVGPQDTEQGAFSATMTGAFQYQRGWQLVKMWLGNTMLSTSFSSFQDKIAVKAFIAGKTSAVTIDATKMRVDAGVRHQTVWTFPHPGPAGQQNYFVGEQTVQTLSNKIMDAAKCNNGLTINSGGLAVPSGGLTITGGGLTVETGNFKVASGSLTVKFGMTIEASGFTVVGDSLLYGGLTITTKGLTIQGTGGLTVQSAGVSFTSTGFNVPAAGLNIRGGGLTLVDGPLTTQRGLDVMNSMTVWGGELVMSSSTGGINFASGSLKVPAAGLPIKNGGLSFDNVGATGSTTLNHYEYFSYTATLFGNLAGSIELEFTRIGRAVTMTIPHFTGTGSSSLVLSLADKSQIPVRFRPRPIAFGGENKGHRFMIPGIRNSLDVAICVSVLLDGNIQFYSGVCGSPWTLLASGEPATNGFYATSLQWITV